MWNLKILTLGFYQCLSGQRDAKESDLEIRRKCVPVAGRWIWFTCTRWLRKNFIRKILEKNNILCYCFQRLNNDIVGFY